MDNIIITLDIDWAPDFAIDFVAERLIDSGAKATWFVTHASSAVDRLREYPDLFELGIHPNFYPGSTHGETPEAILNHCMELVPDAISMRTHGTVQSSRLLDMVMERTSIRVDSSVFLPRASHIKPFVFYGENGAHLTRVPYVWEDDYEMRCPDPVWETGPLLESPGIKVFDFHPVHVFLNNPDLGAYREFWDRVGENPCEGTAKHAQGLVFEGVGPQTMLANLCRLADDGGRIISAMDKII